MSRLNVKPGAVVFDYGNTLVPFGAEEIRFCDRALSDTLVSLFGRVDPDALHRARNADRLRPYSGTPPAYRENDMREITARLVETLYGRPPSEHELAALLRTRFEAFVSAVKAPAYLHGLLDRWAGRTRLAILSNYPDSPALRESLRVTGLDAYFDVVVVSGDVGRVKPHPAVFDRLLERLRLPASACWFVGDNWLADVQGARRAGFSMIRTRQWIPPEHFEKQPGDLDPDAEIGHLRDLDGYLP